MEKIEIIKELWQCIKQRKRWWILPIVVMLIMLSGLIIIANSGGISTVVYTLF